MPYDANRAEEVIRFFEDFLVYIDGPLAGQPIKLRDWQAEPLRQIFGRTTDEGIREIQTAFVQMNKKQGKTEIIAAGMVLFMMTIGAEYGARLFGAANSRDQAAEIFHPCKEMILQSEALQALGFDPRRDIYDSTKTIIFRPRNSRFQAVAAEAGVLHGKKPSFCVFDEIHAMKHRLMIDALREGMGTWAEPLTLYITNMGEIGGSPVFWEEKKYADRVVKDQEFDRRYFAMMQEAPAELTDEQLLYEGPHWKDLNPGLDDFMSRDDMRRACREALQKPQQRVQVLRLRLGRATQPVTAWIPIERWRSCKADFDESDLWGRDCYAGLDLSSKWDFSAVTLCFPEQDGGATFQAYVYCPEGNVAELERLTGRPISHWVRQGLILTTPGERIDLDFVEEHIRELSKRFRILQLAYDPAFAEQLTGHLVKDGIECVEFPQTVTYYNEPMQEFERQLHSKLIRHDGNPVLEYAIESMSVKPDENGRIKPVKIKERRQSSQRIDPGVAALMAFERRIRNIATVYQGDGDLVL